MVPLDFANYGPIILATLVGFFSLAAMLLIPVYRFLNKEERLSARWTAEALRRQDANDTSAESTHQSTTT